MKALWKQTSELHPAFERLHRCLQDDWFLLPYELKLQRAHAEALEAAGILSAAERSALDFALDKLAQRFLGATCPESPAEDLHTWIEGQLTELAGDAGRKIHTARSRNDQVATLIKMYVIDSSEALLAQMNRLTIALCKRAQTWAELSLPLMTHTQFAAPGTAGFWALRFAVAYSRAARRLGQRLAMWHEECPLGSGAVAGSSIPIDRNLQARLLGFQRPSMNALDSTTTRDECLELLGECNLIALQHQCLATDLLLFAQTPLSWIHQPTAFSTGSSMMPNKRNPDALELVRGECNRVLAAQQELTLTMKGLPSGYSRDLQQVKTIVQRAVLSLANVGEVVEEYIATLEFDAKHAAQSMRLGHIDATLEMERQVLDGVPLRDAHHAVAANLETRPSQHFDSNAYQTSGSANPEETRRVAQEILTSLAPDQEQ